LRCGCRRCCRGRSCCRSRCCRRCGRCWFRYGRGRGRRRCRRSGRSLCCSRGCRRRRWRCRCCRRRSRCRSWYGRRGWCSNRRFRRWRSWWRRWCCRCCGLWLRCRRRRWCGRGGCCRCGRFGLRCRRLRCFCRRCRRCRLCHLHRCYGRSILALQAGHAFLCCFGFAGFAFSFGLRFLRVIGELLCFGLRFLGLSGFFRLLVLGRFQRSRACFVGGWNAFRRSSITRAWALFFCFFHAFLFRSVGLQRHLLAFRAFYPDQLGLAGGDGGVAGAVLAHGCGGGRKCAVALALGLYLGGSRRGCRAAAEGFQCVLVEFYAWLRGGLCHSDARHANTKERNKIKAFRADHYYLARWVPRVLYV